MIPPQPKLAIYFRLFCRHPLPLGRLVELLIADNDPLVSTSRMVRLYQPHLEERLTVIKGCA
jgi:hypothetical protein